MRALPFHLAAGADLRGSLEQLAREERATGFVLSVVGNLSEACFACPGQDSPTLVRGELEIITLQGTLSPHGVHLHLSLSDATCQVWGGHLERGSVILKGADLLVGFLNTTASRVQVALAEGCPWSRRTERLLQGLGIRYDVVDATDGVLPEIHINGQLIGGYSELAALHSRGALQALCRG